MHPRRRASYQSETTTRDAGCSALAFPYLLWMRNLSWLGVVAMVGVLAGCFGSGDEPDTKPAEEAQEPAKKEAAGASTSAGGVVKVEVQEDTLGTSNGTDRPPPRPPGG